MAAVGESPAGVVTAFIATVESFDLEGALAFLADDVEYDNVPIGAVHGVDQVRATLGPFVGRFDEIDWPVSRIAATGTVQAGTVLTERVDRFRAGETWLELPVAGVFEVRDGRITLWRDYFDLGTFTRAIESLA
jgi:limonene-1,2-epoxide hydrolase